MIKVVRVNQKGELLSSYTREKAEIKYKVGKWIKAKPEFLKKGYGIFVYDNLENAIKTKTHPDELDTIKYKYYEVEVRGEMPVKPILNYYVASKYGANGIEKLREKFKYVPLLHPVLFRLHKPPLGTRMFKQIKLTKEIEKEKIKKIIRRLK